MKMKIMHFNTLGPLQDDLLVPLEDKITYEYHTEANISEKKALDLLGDHSILILEPSAIKPVTKSFIDQLNNVKHIALVTVGTDWVDLDACKKRGVDVSTPIGASAGAVAEHIFGLFTDLAKRITEFDRGVRCEGAYDFRKYQGTELFGKTLGILGLGNIGKKVLRISRGFNMKVLVFDRSEKTTSKFNVVSLDTVLKESDYIALCLPLTKETENLINNESIQKLKRGVIIANTAREEIVDKTAILKAIEEDIVFGYGIETAIMQKIEPNDPYLKYQNVIVNPHNAFNTEETNYRVNEAIIKNIKNFIDGLRPNESGHKKIFEVIKKT